SSREVGRVLGGQAPRLALAQPEVDAGRGRLGDLFQQHAIHCNHVAGACMIEVGPEVRKMKQLEIEAGAAVGHSPARKDGLDKVTGRARYLDDLDFPGQLWGRTVRSQVAHGNIKSIAFDPRFDWTGIVTVT